MAVCRAVILGCLLACLLYSVAAAQTVRGYALPGSYPTTKECRAYERRHSGVERWRYWVRRYAYRQARMAGKGTWRFVWNEDWVLRVIDRESGGRPSCTLGVHRGLLQVRADHAPGRDLWHGPTNIAVSSQLFARLGAQPWACTMHVGVSPYARRK